MATPAHLLETLSPSPFDVLGSPTSLSGPMDEFVREDLYDDVWNATACAVKDGQVVARTKRGACIMRMEHVHGSPLVVFDHVEVAATADRKPRIAGGADWFSKEPVLVRRSFWFNVSSVKALGDRLRALPRRAWADIVTEVLL